MSIISSVKNPVIQDAVSLFQKHRQDKEFLDILRKHKSFFFSIHSGEKVAKSILADVSKVSITTFDDGEDSPAIASTSKKKKTISFNVHMLEVPDDPKDRAKMLEARVNTLMHEYLHTLGYMHCTNKNTWYNKRTIPYAVGALFAAYVKEQNPHLFIA